MSAAYKPVTWTPAKVAYDAVLLSAVTAYIFVYLRIAPHFQSVTKPLDDSFVHIEAFGSCAFLMFSFVLAVGPLARLDPRFLPLLYNRRHFGVMTCVVALAHANFVLAHFFDYGTGVLSDRYVAFLSANTSYGQVLGFPFEAFGVFTLAILIVMAVTSHDFWLKFLGPPVWKAIHMAAYVGYFSIVLHVSLGPLQGEINPVFAIVFVASVVSVAVLHVAAARAGWRFERTAVARAAEAPWIDVGALRDLAEGRALVVPLGNGERVAVFRYGGKLSAVSNACAHQNGPLGEGRIVDGCITCPWHGYQYRPEDGCAPPPFTEKIATYRVQLARDRVLVDPHPNPPGTYVEPVRIVET